MASLGNQHCANCIGSRHTCVPDLYRISPPGTHGLIPDDLFLPLGSCASRNLVQSLWGISCEQYYRTLSNILNL